MSADPIDETIAAGDFDAVYQAVSGTARGRWFIQEFLKRSGSANTQLIINAIGQLRTDIAPAPGSADTQTSEVLRRELAEMSQSISQTRQEIAAIQPTGGPNTNDRIMEATGELDGIITATERATGDILGAAENIQACVERLRANEVATDICDDVEAQIMDIFTACSFQDITGQRTTKVINVLRYLEQRVNAMINIWGPDGETDGETDGRPVTAADDARPDAHLLNGPQPDGEGHGQDAIDELMASFDADAAAETTVEAAFDAPADAVTAATADLPAAPPEPQPEPQDTAPEPQVPAAPAPADDHAADAPPVT